jgi:membrane protease YdiL (CAAX protease family)
MPVWMLGALLDPKGIERLELPLARLRDVSVFDALLGYAPIKALLPIPILVAIAPLVIWFFRSTWRQLDLEAAEYRARVAGRMLGQDARKRRPTRRAARKRPREIRPLPHQHNPSASVSVPRLRRVAVARTDPAAAASAARVASTPWTIYRRPAACLLITAVILTLHDYYGGRQFYKSTLQPWLSTLEAAGSSWVNLRQWDELYGYAWWVIARLVGYVLVPFPLWKLLFPKDSLLDMGLRTKDFLRHAWVYGVCLLIVLPLLFVVSRQPDFAEYYPFYKNCSRSWLDLALWESIYCLQFFALEMFFRGWIVGALRKTMGAGAIFAMAVPYCMIHYGKPYLEAHGAIVAGVVLGSLAVRTKSIYSGFLVHITVALGMDLVALSKGAGLPSLLLPPG